MATVGIRGIAKGFGTTPVLKGVSLDIAHGEFLTLVGPSGCGKSTLLRIIAGLDYADAGSILIDGQPVDAQAPKQRDVAMVFQSYALYPYMTVAQNIALPLVMRRLSPLQRLPLLGRLLPGTAVQQAQITADVRTVADGLDIAHLLQRKPAQLSGGQRQRVALGRAMVRQPKVFLMDEPLSNLDAKLRVQMRAEIAELHRRLKTTFIYVTHDQAEAMTMSDRVAVMLHGELLQVAPPAVVYRDPASLAVAEFIGSPKINILPAGLRSDRAVESLGLTLPIRLPGHIGSQIHLGLRAEAFDLLPAVRPNANPGVWHGHVTHREDLGADLFLHVQLEHGGHRLVLRSQHAEAASLMVGSPLGLRPKPDQALLFDADGRRLRPALDVAGDGTILAWDTATAEARQFAGHHRV
ncbi:MAG: ABC transporter ATP-binding protein [Ferrovibrio sp.]|uniref:ABC transporter ATP-binding protein n=1 Tax=Ferrovibrio sp. TaxID=1917215 RepID=UPI00261DDEFC|nr:ABC transporter ATP-binding protein [Ferrovibrio sp.]MCW0233900.1 ABC transporter ATP-binding protein [Ferrovibrio sp.]